MAEVDVDGRAGVAGDQFGATGQVRLDAAALERRGQPLPRVAGLQDHHDRETRVGGHVTTDDRHGRLQPPAVARGEREACAALLLIDDLHDPIGARGSVPLVGDVGSADRDKRHLARRDDVGPRCGVEADDGASRTVRAEQRELGLEVLGHVGIVVEMVVGEVREPGDVEHHPVDASPRQRLRAHLHGHGFDAAFPHQRQQRVHLVCLGRGQSRHDDLSGDVALGGGRESGHRADLRQDALEEVRHARLAVGAGRAEQEGQVVVGAGRVDTRGHVAESRSRVVDDEHRDAGRARDRLSGGVGDHRDRSGGGGVGRELRAVPVHPAHRDEDVARSQVRGGERDARQRDAGEVVRRTRADLAREVGEAVRRRILGPEHGWQMGGGVGRHGGIHPLTSRPLHRQARVPWVRDRIRHRLRPALRGPRRVDRSARDRSPGARQALRGPRGAVHDRLRADAVVPPCR